MRARQQQQKTNEAKVLNTKRGDVMVHEEANAERVKIHQETDTRVGGNTARRGRLPRKKGRKHEGSKKWRVVLAVRCLKP